MSEQICDYCEKHYNSDEQSALDSVCRYCFDEKNEELKHMEWEYRKSKL